MLYDIALLMATYAYRNDQNIPFAYLIVMNVCGVLCKIAFITDFVTYLVLPYYEYLAYRELLGREFTMLGTLTYFIPMCVSVLMTLNRFFIVLRPTDQRAFGQKRIFFYSFLILILCFTLLLIPRLSYCPVNFLASTLVFLTACAPERHPVTKFTNINAIWVPTTLLVINLLMVLHLKANRYDIYSRIRQKSSVISMSSSNSLAQSQIRREHMLMRQTVAITVGLSFYEVGSLLMRTFPEIFLRGKNSFSSLGVSDQCQIDTNTWLNSLKLVSEVTVECLVSKKCTKKERKLIEDNFYALEQLDAFGKLPSSGLFEIPLVFDGSYQECQRIRGKKYETNYCYLVLVPGRNSSCSIGGGGGFTPSAAFFRSATCMSESCTPDDLPTLFNKLPLMPFTACAAFCSKFPVEKDSAFWGFSGFMVVTISVLIVATFVDFIRQSQENDSKVPGTWLKMLLAFSIWTNAEALLSVKVQKPGFIKCLDCIRFLSMLWVVTGHTFTFLVPPDTLRSLSTFMEHFWNHLLLNAFVSVDTFFLLSGIVVAYLFFKQRPKESQIKSPMTWILFYIHRYLRLTPPYMIFIGFFVVYGPYVQGPFSASQFNTLVPGIQTCQTNWWRNLLYINNMGGSETACYAPSWYLAVDTQMYIFAPIVLIGLYYSLAIGSGLVAVGCLASVVTVYLLYVIYDLPADFFGNGNTNLLYDMIYHKPWIRCPPYLLGLLVGYGLAVYGQKKIRIHWTLAVIGWIVAFGLGAACMFSTYDYDKGAQWSIFARASYYNFSRIAWSVFVSWVIVANHLGWGGPIDAFMSHPIWQPLGRLSYCAYIVHFFTLFWYLNINDSSMHYYFTFQVFIYYAVPACILSYIFAFFWSSLFEVPILKLEKMLIEAILMRGTQSNEENRNHVARNEETTETGSSERLIRL